MRPSLLIALALVGSVVGCKDPPPSASETPKPLASPSAPPKIAAAPPSASAPASHPDKVEVEITGLVELPKGYKPKGTIYVYVSHKDCLATDAPVLGRVQPPDSMRFFIEVFPPWASDITICAAEDAGEGKPSTLYTKATGTFHAEKTGEVNFDNVKLVLSTQPAKMLPKTSASAAPTH